MALVRFIDGQQRGKTATVDNAAISGEGRYRFKKREITKTGGRIYYLKSSFEEALDRQEGPGVDGCPR
jgi:hypothetical protein